MIPAPIPTNERERLASLDRMNLLSTPREASFDRLTRLAQHYFGVEIVAISLIDADRQWFKSQCGLDVAQTDRSASFCGHAIANSDLFIVNDATEDERFYDNPMVVAGPGIRFYAGRPLRNKDGHNIGTLCLISTAPRRLAQHEKQALDDFGHMAQLLIEAREVSEAYASLVRELDKAKRDALICPLSGLWNRAGVREMFERERQRSIRTQSPLGMALVDIDHFKTINDTYGHLVGDQGIRLVAETLTECARRYDVIGRVGGEEFVIILPGAKLSELQNKGERILKSFRERAHLLVSGIETRPITVSIGLASTQADELSTSS